MFVILFLIVLSALVLVHEWGHFIAARMFGVKVDEFGYGFPPRLFGFVRVGHAWKRVKGHDRKSYANTIWSLNWLPLGGFVRLKGEQSETMDGDSFASRSAWQRIIILAAGVIMNVLLAIAIFTGGFLIGIPAATDGLPSNAIVSGVHIEITHIIPDAPAVASGLVIGDTIEAIDGLAPSNAQEALQAIAAHSALNKPFAIEIVRHHVLTTVSVTPAYLGVIKRPGVGVGLTDVATVRFNPLDAITQAFTVTMHYAAIIVRTLWSLLSDLITAHHLSGDVSGPIGIAVATGDIARQGTWPLLQFVALLSINLAIINFLPIPALDGGRALFIVIEALRRKRNNPHVENALHHIGFVTLLILVILVTVHDLGQYGGMMVHGVTSFFNL